MKIAVPAAVAFTILLTTGCAAVAETASDTKAAMTKTMSDDPIADAQSAFDEATAAGCAWRDTSKMIKKAKALVTEGKIEEAHALAGRAMRQSQLGMEQCESENKRLSS